MILDEEYETKTVHETDAETIKDLYTKKYDMSKPETLSDIPKEKTITMWGGNKAKENVKSHITAVNII